MKYPFTLAIWFLAFVFAIIQAFAHTLNGAGFAALFLAACGIAVGLWEGRKARP